MRLLPLFVVLLCGLFCRPPAYGQTFDPNKTYKITNKWQSGKSLDVLNDGKDKDIVWLAKTSSVTGQAWHIKSLGGGYFRLATEWQGPGKSLDIRHVPLADGMMPFLGKTKEDAPGQAWKITREEGGYYRLTNKSKGDDQALDVMNDGDNDAAWLRKKANALGQYWKITLIEE